MRDIGVVDACVFHDWGGPLALTPYMSQGYREWITREGDRAGPRTIKSVWVHDHPVARQRADTRPEKGVPGSDPELMSEHLFSSGTRERVVLGYDEGVLATANPNPFLAREVTAAANDWTIQEWLDRDKRFYGMVLISNALPEDAAAEIRRAGVHERMVAVAMGANCLGRGFGHPNYDPIHRAAAEMDLPLVFQTTSETASDLLLPTLAGGRAATFSEWDALSAQPMSSHLASLITHGVFDVYPDLRVLLIGGGAAWIPAFVWRLDYWSKVMSVDVPWLKGLPSEYVREHARFSTVGLEDPGAGPLASALKQVPGQGSSLMYASGYPNYDWEQPETIAARVPDDWHAKVFRDNAIDFFRWPGHKREASLDAIPREDITDRRIVNDPVRITREAVD